MKTEQANVEVVPRGAMVELFTQVGEVIHQVMLSPAQAVIVAGCLRQAANQSTDFIKNHTCLFCKRPTVPGEIPDCCAACAPRVG